MKPLMKWNPDIPDSPPAEIVIVNKANKTFVCFLFCDIINLGDKMYAYIKGKVTEVNHNYIVVENNNLGYLIHTANPFSFGKQDETFIYLYQAVKEDDITLYGFKTLAEKELFLKLLSVKGMGPKMTLPLLATGSPEGIIDAIERENILYLKKFPKIGDKLARQIILDLKGKLTKDEQLNINTNEELTEVLLNLGYKNKEIIKILPNVNHNLELEEQIKTALKLLLK